MFGKPSGRLAFALLIALSSAGAQSAPGPIAFEVATIKPSAPLDLAAMRAGNAHIGTRIDSARVDIGSVSLFRLICAAYRLRPYQIAGPDWLKSALFDIQAKLPAGSTPDQLPSMLQSLLADRFGLKVHSESKEQPVYALSVATGGIKMKESTADFSGASPAQGEQKAPEMSLPTLQGNIRFVRTPQGATIEMPDGEIGGKLRLTVKEASGRPEFFHAESSGTTMKALAQMLSVGVVDRPVVDATGLIGMYEVAVDVSPEEAMAVAQSAISFLPMAGRGGGGDAGRRPEAGRIVDGGASDPPGVSVFKSLQNLGLKLEPRKMPLEILVVEHVEKTPSAN